MQHYKLISQEKEHNKTDRGESQINYSSTGNLSDPKIKKIKSNILEKESTLKQIWKKEKPSNEKHVDNK